MSRRDGRAAQVETDADGRPRSVAVAGRALAVVDVLDHWREWIGIFDGEPERDVWRVETSGGVCELHRLYYPRPGAEEPQEGASSSWLLACWED